MTSGHSAVSLFFFIYISDNDVDGETVDCGLTESMIANLFDKSFKKQLKFRDFTHRYKEVILTLEAVNPKQQTCEAPVSPANQRYYVLHVLFFHLFFLAFRCYCPNLH